MQRQFLIGVILLLIALLGWMILFWVPVTQQEQSHQRLSLADTPVGGDFILHSYRGTEKLSDFRSKLVLLYFGYTWCPDICPTSLGMTSLALDELSGHELSQVQVLFVSVDPERDTLERLKHYAAYFHPKILGVTGSPEEVAEVARLYGAAYRKVKQASAMDYVVDHSADTYLIDQQGQLVEVIPHGTPAESIVAKLKKYLG